MLVVELASRMDEAHGRLATIDYSDALKLDLHKAPNRFDFLLSNPRGIRRQSAATLGLAVLSKHWHELPAEGRRCDSLSAAHTHFRLYPLLPPQIARAEV